LGRVIFSRKAEPSVDWSAVASHLQDISKPSSLSASDVNVDPDAAPSVTLAFDPPPSNHQPGLPVEPAPSPEPQATAERDPLELLSLLTAIPSRQS
jgi:hypothetical protein